MYIFIFTSCSSVIFPELRKGDPFKELPGWVINPDMYKDKICAIGNSIMYKGNYNLKHFVIIEARANLINKLEPIVNSEINMNQMDNYKETDYRLTIHANSMDTKYYLHKSWISKQKNHYILVCIDEKELM